MDFLEELFGGEALTYAQLLAKVTERGYKVADLSTGNYVAKKKYEDEVSAKDATIKDLNGQIKTRDTDIATLRKSLEDGSVDSETKLADLTTQLTNLQSDYSTTKAQYEAKLKAQLYEFAVKEFANGLKFSSDAAKRDFISQMNSAELKMKDKQILGASDFAEQYKLENATAFVAEQEAPEQTQLQGGDKPFFVKPTTPTPNPDANPFDSVFNFAGVR